MLNTTIPVGPAGNASVMVSPATVTHSKSCLPARTGHGGAASPSVGSRDTSDGCAVWAGSSLLCPGVPRDLIPDRHSESSLSSGSVVHTPLPDSAPRGTAISAVSTGSTTASHARVCAEVPGS